MFEIRLALRYLWAARKRAHTAFLSLISTIGVAVGVATLLISLALLSGLQGQIKQRLMSTGPQLLIEPKAGASIADADAIVQRLKLQQNVRVEQVVSGIAWASAPDGRRGRPIRLRSYESDSVPAAERSFGREWAVPVEEGRPQIFITRAFAAEIGQFLGDEIVIVAPRMKLTPFGPVPVTRKFVISRIVTPPSEDRAPEAWLPLEVAGGLFGTGGAPSSIEGFASAAQAEQLKSELQSKFKNVSVKSWVELNRPLFLALRLEKIVMFATISLIVFVAALNLISSLSMLIVEKRPQVGILRTLGSTEASILGVFLAVGLFIGVGGTLLGNVIGLGVSWAANRYHLVRLPSDAYYLDHLPFLIEMPDVILVNAIAVFLSIAATYYPARLASRLDPIVAIRDE